MGMMKVAAGFAVGYVLGTRTGRDTYEQIVDGARKLSNHPAVDRAQAKIEDATSAAADVAPTKANDVLSSGRDAVAAKVKSSRNSGTDDRAGNARLGSAPKEASTATPIYRDTLADNGNPAI